MLFRSSSLYPFCPIVVPTNFSVPSISFDFNQGPQERTQDAICKELHHMCQSLENRQEEIKRLSFQ